MRPRYVGPYGAASVWRVRSPEDLEDLGYPANPRKPWPPGPALVLEGPCLGGAVRLDPTFARALAATSRTIPARVRRVLAA